MLKKSTLEECVQNCYFNENVIDKELSGAGTSTASQVLGKQFMKPYNNYNYNVIKNRVRAAVNVNQRQEG